jgi:RNA polymerase sigma factor (sigma-70 family)
MERFSEIIAKCKDGTAGENDWIKLFAPVHPRLVLALAVFSGTDEALNEDLVQETMVRVVKRLETFQGETPEAFRAWCVRIAVNIGNDHFRKAGTTRLSLFGPETIQRLREAGAEEDGTHPGLSADVSYLLSLIEKLENPCRQLLTLHCVKGLDYEDIAAVMGKSFDAVRVAIGRCIEDLREKFME